MRLRLLLTVLVAGVVFAVSAAAQQDPNALATKFRAERQTAVDSGASRIMPAFPLERADQFARRGEQAMQAGRNADAARFFREARWRLPPTLPVPIPYLARLLGSPRLKHGEWVSAVAWNADGSLIASAGRDARVRVWDMNNGRMIRDYAGHAEWVKAVAFLPSGKVISAGGKEIRIWDAVTGADIKSITSTSGNVKSLAAQPAGNHVAASGEDRSVHVWDIESGKEAYALGPFNSAVEYVTWSANGNMVAAVAGDGGLAVWDVGAGRKKLLDLKITSGAPGYGVRISPDGKSIAACGEKFAKIYALTGGDKSEAAGATRREFVGAGAHTDMVTCVAYSPDGKTLATASRDKSIRLWDVGTGQRLRTLLGHTEKVNAIEFSPDGNQLVSVADDQAVRLWDLAPTAPLALFAGHKGPVWTTAVSPDGTRTASGGDDRVVRVWETANGKELRALTGHTAAITALAWSVDGQRLFSASGDKTVRAWDMTSGQPRTIAELEAAGLALAIAPDGRRLAVAGADRKVRIIDPGRGAPAVIAAAHHSAVSAIAWRADGNMIASVSVDGMIKLWDVSENKELATGRAHDSGGAAAVLFTPDSQRVITCGGEGQVKLWKIAAPLAKEPLLVLSGHSGPVTTISISFDGKLLASGGADTIVKVWDLNNRTELQSFRGHGEWVTDVAMSRTGGVLVSADAAGKVHVWSLESNPTDSIASGHTRGATAIAAGANALASGGYDRTAIVWDLANGREPRVLSNVNASVRTLALSPDSTRLAMWTEDRRIRCFDAIIGRELRVLDTNEFRVNVLAVYPDNKRVLAWQHRDTTNDEDVSYTITRFDMETGATEEVIAQKGRGQAQCLAFSTDLSIAAIGSADGKLHLWKIDEKKKLGDDRNAHTANIADVAVTPDNKFVVTMDVAGEAKVWSIDSAVAEPVQRIKTGTAGTLQGLAISPDGKRLLAFGSNREVAVFEIVSGQQVRRWSLPQKPNAATFTADSRQVATANDDGTVYLLDLP